MIKTELPLPNNALLARKSLKKENLCRDISEFVDVFQGLFTNLKIEIFKLTTWNVCVAFLLPFTLISRQLQVKKLQFWRGLFTLSNFLYICGCFSSMFKFGKIMCCAKSHLNLWLMLDNLPGKMLPYFDPITARKLKDCAIAVFYKK